MQKLYYKPEGRWVGDCMPFAKDGVFYLYHQRDTRNPCPFGEPFGWSLVTTTDFVHYTDCGEAIPGGGEEAQDQFIYAGSVFEGEGRYHAFYTGYNRNFVKQGRASQVLMHAASADLIHWEKSRDALRLPPQSGYDKDDWRDPFVLWDEEKGRYLLILGARKLDGKKKINGCTVQFTSRDLKNWKFEGPIWAPCILTMHEMPDLFKIGQWWYLLTSDNSDRHNVIYRMSKNLEGPWIAPTDDAFDGRAYYAARTFPQNGRRYLFGWVSTKEDCDDKKNFQWAGALSPHEVYQRPDGTLGVRPPETVWNAFGPREAIEGVKLRTLDWREERVLARETGKLYSFEADLRFAPGTRAFALRLHEDAKTGEAHEYRFYVGENRFAHEFSPNQPWFQLMNLGQERPIKLNDNERYHVQLIVDDTIATLYVNGVALSIRAYRRPGDCLSLSVTDGAVSMEKASFAKGSF